MKTKQAVVVTTEHRGVFFGYVTENSDLPNKITLENARMCVYWSADVKGILGLAATGPTKECKITHAIPSIVAYKVTAVLDCTNDAAAKWEKGVWN